MAIFNRRQFLTSKCFNDILNDESHKLYDLLPSKNISIITSGKREFLKISILGQMDVGTILYRIIL